jgi:hypothetical protein
MVRTGIHVAVPRFIRVTSKTDAKYVHLGSEHDDGPVGDR